MSYDHKPNLKKAFADSGDVRFLEMLIKRYKYSVDDANEVINFYEPDKKGKIPEVEHIFFILNHFPDAEISHKTMKAIEKSFPTMAEYIYRLKIKIT